MLNRSRRLLPSGSAVPAHNVTSADNGVLIEVDATLGYGGLHLPAPASVQTPPASGNEGDLFTVGLKKIDDSSNPLQAFATPGHPIDGYQRQSAIMLGDTLVFATGGHHWSLISRFEVVKQGYSQHRTPAVSASQHPYKVSAMHDRCGLIRSLADNGTGHILLPTRSPGQFTTIDGVAHEHPHLYFEGSPYGSIAYRRNFDVSIIALGGNNTEVHAGPNVALNEQINVPLTLSTFQEVRLDFDTAEWKIRN